MQTRQVAEWRGEFLIAAAATVLSRGPSKIPESRRSLADLGGSGQDAALDEQDAGDGQKH